MFSDDEDDSDVDEILAEIDVEHSDEEYDAENQGRPVFDRAKGDDNWVGRRIIKSFGDAGDFEGVVYAVDDDINRKGYRLFLVHYFDDPDDGESMWPEELYRHVNACKIIL